MITVLDDLFGNSATNIFVLCIDGLDIIHDDLLLPVFINIQKISLGFLRKFDSRNFNSISSMVL